MESPFEILRRHVNPTNPLQRDSPREACAIKTDAKLVSNIKDRFWEVAGELEMSEFRGNFTGLREIFLFCLLGEEIILVGPGGPRAGEATSPYSTPLCFTTSEFRTSGLDAVSLRGLSP